MSLPPSALFGRRFSLILSTPAGGPGLELSELHFTFSVEQSDSETPNSARFRVYNLSPATQKRAMSFNRVVLNAGYEGAAAPYGKIFDGDIKQFGTGRSSATEDFLDIFAADGDTFYNYTVLNSSLEAGLTPRQQLDKIMTDIGAPPVQVGQDGLIGGTLVRGKVMFGMFKDEMRRIAESQNNGRGPAGWSMQDGRVQILQVDDYLPGEAVELNALTGMIGVPEQTQEGIKVRSLLNPRIRCGGLMKINNRDINQITQTDPNIPVPYNQYTAIQLLAKTDADGIYRVYVAEHEGDSRGNPWYTNIVGLLVAKDAQAVVAP